MSAFFDKGPQVEGDANSIDYSKIRARQEVSLRDLVARLTADRARRSDWFDGSLFSDPAWDLLVDIFKEHLEGRESTLRKLLVGSFLTPATAIRWLDVLEDQGAIAWCDTHGDSKKAVRLTERGVVGLTCYSRALAKRWGLRLSDE